MTKIAMMMAAGLAAALILLSHVSTARADDLDGARAKLAELRANRAHETVVTTPAPEAAPAPAAKASPAPAGSPAPWSPPLVNGRFKPGRQWDMTKATGPGRPDLRTSGTFQYMHAGPFTDMPWRVIIEEHAHKVGDHIRGAKIVHIDEKTATFTKDGETWTLPASMQ